VDQMELSEVPFKYPSEISGGMQKRVALARALITDPKIVLFDEPTTGQDPIRKNAILGMIAQNQKKFGFTTIMISHEIPDVFFISDRILILYDGRIIFQGTYDELDSFDHPMVDEFIKSLEGFQDELTGLHSKKSFNSVYEKSVKKEKPHESLAVIVFTLDDIDEMNEALGTTRTQEVLRYLGEYVNKHFGHTGISTRIGRDQIATILPQTDRQSAERMLQGFTTDLQGRGLGDMQAETDVEPSVCTFSVLSGLAEGKASEDMDVLSERARSSQEAIARFECKIGR
jgi:phospholipid/cholesterol/gamma-HCH transport system ATP-binding protein